MLVAALLVACTSRDDSGTEATDTVGSDSTVVPDTADSNPTDSTPPAETGETAAPGDSDSTAPVRARCPAGMSPIPTEDPLYCIHTFEIVDDGGDRGDHDQHAEGAISPAATVHAERGVIPATGYSFSQAQAVCANTRAVDADGTDWGPMHLATASEWQDAGDGVVGNGGTLFPWGNDWDVSKCVIVGDNGEALWPEVQPTGSLETCVSPFGVYDQIGNLWEWVDSEIPADIDLWLATWPGFSIVDGGLYEVEAGAADRLSVYVTGMVDRVQVADDGRISVYMTESSWTGHTTPHGWAYLELSNPGSNFLPIELSSDGVAVDGIVTAEVTIADWADGTSIPDKRGGAYYAGPQSTLSGAGYGHSWDFDGSIGFRCACDPFPG